MKLKQLWQSSLLWILVLWCILSLVYHAGWLVIGSGLLVWLVLLYVTARGVFWTYVNFFAFNKSKTAGLLLKAISYKPLILQPYIMLGTIYLKDKRWPDAIGVLEQAVAIPNIRGAHDVQILLAIACREFGDYQRALEIYTALTNQGVKNFIIYINLALTNFKLARFDEAMEAVGKARSLNYRSTQPVLLAGRIHFERREFEKAQDDYKWAIDHMSWPVESYYWLGRAELELGKREAALDHLKTAVERIKDDPEMSDVSLTEAEEWLRQAVQG